MAAWGTGTGAARWSAVVAMLAGIAFGQADQQPEGSLSGVIVYCSAGHGWTAGSSSWATQRPLLYDMVEDMGNLDQMNRFAHYCFNAGATVVPMRPLGYQRHEVVMDNDEAGVTWTGSWSNSSATIFYGDAGDVPYRYANVSSSGATATARYTPAIPEAGVYPVYCWTRRGTDRVNQLYRIVHCGGTSEVRVNHKRVGNGWVWLGNYHFHAGSSGYVEISNHTPGTSSGVVIADTIRFGNGMGDIDRGFGVSGYERELEASRYWIQNMVGQGMSSNLYDLSGYSDGSDNVGAPARMADYMNDERDGGFWDRIYLGFHSNAATGTRRGPLGLYSTRNSADVQAQQEAFGLALVNEIETDMEWGDDGIAFVDGWANNSIDTYGASYGELNTSSNDEMNSTIIEVGYHDNADDARMLRNPAARDVIARACYQGLVRHLHDFGGTVANVSLPAPPTAVRAINTGSGSVTIAWEASTTNAAMPDAPTGYVVTRSADGNGFGNPITVAGGQTTTMISGLTVGETYYFRVAAVNAGGRSMPSETVGVIASAGLADNLVVNGFDRVDASIAPTRYFANNINGDCTLPRIEGTNRGDYVIQHLEALAAAGVTGCNACANEAVVTDDVLLADYNAVYWILGVESTADETFSSAEQARVQAFFSVGGNLFVSGAELAWDLDNKGTAADQAFLSGDLRCTYASDDANQYRATGAAGSIFAGLGSVSFDDGTGDTYHVKYPDTLNAANGSTVAMRYGTATSTGSVAAIQYSGDYKAVVLGFPFETVTDAGDRAEIMDRVAGFFEPPAPAGPAPLTSGIGKSGSVARGAWKHYTIAVPANTASLTIAITGTNDADLYVRRGAEPTASTWDYRPYLSGSSESVSVTSPAAGAWYISVYGYSTATSSYTVTATAAAGTSGGGATTDTEALAANVSLAQGAWKHYTLTVPAGADQLQIALAGSGDGDLYVSRGSQPTTTSYDYRPYLNGSNETVTVANPASGTWHVSVRGYTSATFSLEATLTGGQFGSASSGGSGAGPTTLLSTSGSVAQGTWKHYAVTVPAGTSTLTVAITGTNDADLYVRKTTQPTAGSYDFRPYLYGSNETVTVTTATSPAVSSGTWRVAVYGYSASASAFTLTVTAQ